MALLSILAGVAGFFLRRQEVATVFDPISGLATRGATISILLIAFSVLVVALLFVMSFLLPKREFQGFTEAFGGSVALTALRTFLGGLIFGLSLVELVDLFSTGALDGFSIARLGAGALAGLMFCLMAALSHRNTNVAIPASVPVFWLCIWLIVSHIERAANPVLLAYVYNLFALAALLLALYYIAGFAFRQNRPGRMMFCASVAIFFIGVTMADEMALTTRMTFLALAVTVLFYQLSLSFKLSQPIGE